MLQRAASAWGIDEARSWMIGDRVSDVEARGPGRIRTILISADAALTNPEPDHRCSSFCEATDLVVRALPLGGTGLAPNS
jgi:histidinol phosphatase-like enzyme